MKLTPKTCGLCGKRHRDVIENPTWEYLQDVPGRSFTEPDAGRWICRRRNPCRKRFLQQQGR